jgi:hypothetical protein
MKRIQRGPVRGISLKLQVSSGSSTEDSHLQQQQQWGDTAATGVTAEASLAAALQYNEHRLSGRQCRPQA